MNYKEELAKELQEVKTKIKRKVKELNKAIKDDGDFLHIHNQLNLLRIDRKTIESKLQNRTQEVYTSNHYNVNK